MSKSLKKEDILPKFKYWAYLQQDNTYKIKRYFGDADLIEAKKSPFVKEVFKPFEAISKEEAEKYVIHLIKHRNKVLDQLLAFMIEIKNYL